MGCCSSSKDHVEREVENDDIHYQIPLKSLCAATVIAADLTSSISPQTKMYAAKVIAAEFSTSKKTETTLCDTTVIPVGTKVGKSSNKKRRKKKKRNFAIEYLRKKRKKYKAKKKRKRKEKEAEKGGDKNKPMNWKQVMGQHWGTQANGPGPCSMPWNPSTRLLVSRYL